MEIQQDIPIALRIDFSGQYIGGLTESSFDMTPLKGKIDKQETVVVFEFISQIKSKENDFILSAGVRIPFIIPQKQHVDNKDCLDIMNLGIKYLKTVINTSVVASDETIQIAEPTTDVLYTLMLPFLEAMNGNGFYPL